MGRKREEEEEERRRESCVRFDAGVGGKFEFLRLPRSGRGR